MAPPDEGKHQTTVTVLAITVATTQSSIDKKPCQYYVTAHNAFIYFFQAGKCSKKDPIAVWRLYCV